MAGHVLTCAVLVCVYRDDLDNSTSSFQAVWCIPCFLLIKLWVCACRHFVLFFSDSVLLLICIQGTLQPACGLLKCRGKSCFTLGENKVPNWSVKMDFFVGRKQLKRDVISSGRHYEVKTRKIRGNPLEIKVLCYLYLSGTFLCIYGSNAICRKGMSLWCSYFFTRGWKRGFYFLDSVI